MIEWIDEVPQGRGQDGMVGQLRIPYRTPAVPTPGVQPKVFQKANWQFNAFCLIWRQNTPVPTRQEVDIRSMSLSEAQLHANQLKTRYPNCYVSFCRQRRANEPLPGQWFHSDNAIELENLGGKPGCGDFPITPQTGVSAPVQNPRVQWLGQPKDCFKNPEFQNCYNFAQQQSSAICQTSQPGPGGVTVWGPGYPSKSSCLQQELARALQDLNCAAVCGECGTNASGKPCNSVEVIKKVQCILGIQPTGVWDAATANALRDEGVTYKSIAEGCVGPDPTLPGPVIPQPCPDGQTRDAAGNCVPVQPQPTGAKKKSGAVGILLLAGAALGAIALSQAT